MKWLWQNTTQVGFGENAVQEHLDKFVANRSRVLCTFGGGSIDKNGARDDVTKALSKLECEVRWEGGLTANPEYKRCMEVVKSVREFQPDIVIAVGGGSVIDGTKFICCAAKIGENEDAWDTIMIHKNMPSNPYKFGTVLTIPATGSEWNNGFVISRNDIKWKIAAFAAYPYFSLLDPRYTLTLPVRQLRNGVFDAFTHCIDQFLMPPEVPMFDHFWMSILKELVDIGTAVIQPNASIELHERLIMACSFALNQIFTLPKPTYWEIHFIGHILTARYDIDHAATLSMVMVPFLESQLESRKEIYAHTAEFVFGVTTGSTEDKARSLITHIKQFINDLGMPTKVSQWEGVTIHPGDVDSVTDDLMQQATGGKPFGYQNCCTRELNHSILAQIIQ